MTAETEARAAPLPNRQQAVLLATNMIEEISGILYEMIIGKDSCYLLGNSVYQFSLTIGFFMFAMGVGSHLSRFIGGRLIETFVHVEMALAIVGGLCSITLFMVFPAAPQFYTATMFAFIFVIGCLVGVEIPLLTRVLAERHGTRRSIADVLSLDYVGALIGSVAFPLLLLPTLGLIASSFAIGLINISVAILNVIWLRDHLAAPGRTLAAAIGAFGLLILLTLSANRITSYAQDHLYFDQIVWKRQSPYQSLVVTHSWPHRDLRLFIDGHLQFSAQDEHRYHEALVHPVMSVGGAAPARVLILGGGDGLAAREVLKHDAVQTIDLVDLDPDMTWLGENFPPVVELNKGSLQAPEVSIYNQDAFVFVRNTDVRYDRVIIDFPDPHNEAISKLYSQEFYAMVMGRLAPGGAMVTQSSSPFFARRTFWAVAATIESIFPKTVSYNVQVPSFGVWGFHLAFKDADASVGPAPKDLAFMSDAVFAAAQVFPCDLSRPDGLAPNSIFDPSLYQRYTEDLRSGPQLSLTACS